MPSIDGSGDARLLVGSVMLTVRSRNLPPCTAIGCLWTIDTNKFEPQRDIADFDGVLNQVKAFGYYIFEADG